MLVGNAGNKPFALECIQAVKSRFIGGDVAAQLDFSDEGRLAVFSKVALNKLKHLLLFIGQSLHG